MKLSYKSYALQLAMPIYGNKLVIYTDKKIYHE